jgi:hypothetical protein
MSTITLQRGRRSPETFLSDRLYRGTEKRPFRPAAILPTTSEAQWPLVIPFGEGVFVFEPAPDDWIVPILKKVCELGSLPPNWNSYGGQPIRPEIAEAAVTLLLNLLTPADPLPSVVPTTRGGILLEWHEGGIDLEVDIQSPLRFHVALEDGDHEEEYDRTDLEFVHEKLNLLRSRLK